MNLLMAMSYAAFASTKVSTDIVDGALTLLGDEWQGLALDFTDDTYVLRTALGAETLLGIGPSFVENGLGVDFTDNSYVVRI
jgi:hypothetical protein